MTTAPFIQLHFASNGQETLVHPGVIAWMYATKRHFYADGSSCGGVSNPNVDYTFKPCTHVIFNYGGKYPAEMYAMETMEQIVALMNEGKS